MTSTEVIWYAAPAGAIRGFSFSLSSPISNPFGDFDASQLSGAITSGDFDGSLVIVFVDGPGVPPTELDFTTPMTGTFTLASATASVIDANGIETLTIPINTGDIIIENNITGIDMHLSGNIVATAVIPEPASLAVVVLLALLCLRRRSASVSP